MVPVEAPAMAVEAAEQKARQEQQPQRLPEVDGPQAEDPRTSWRTSSASVS
jgi:hypothetical protein